MTDIASKVTVTNPSAKANDGSPCIYYVTGKPYTAGQPYLIRLAAGGAAWEYGTGSQYDYDTRGAGLTSSSGYPATKDLAADYGGIFRTDPGANWLATAQKVHVPYLSSDLSIGNGATIMYKNGVAEETVEFRGYVNITAAIEQILASADAQLRKGDGVLLVGSSANGYGLAMNWPRVYDLARAMGYAKVKGVADGGFPFAFYPWTGPDRFFARREREQRTVWNVPDAIVNTNGAALVNSWTKEQRKAFMVMYCQTDTAALRAQGLDIEEVSAAEALYAVRYAAAVRHDLGGAADVHTYCTWFVTQDGTGEYDSAHVHLTDALYDVEMAEGMTPQQALQTFWNCDDDDDDAVHIIEPRDAGDPYPTS